MLLLERENDFLLFLKLIDKSITLLAKIIAMQNLRADFIKAMWKFFIWELFI